MSVNSASKAELAAIKGMPTKVAEGIVSKRPFKSLDDLAGVKGMGAWLLAKLRSKLKLQSPMRCVRRGSLKLAAPRRLCRIQTELDNALSQFSLN